MKKIIAEMLGWLRDLMIGVVILAGAIGFMIGWGMLWGKLFFSLLPNYLPDLPWVNFSMAVAFLIILSVPALWMLEKFLLMRAQAHLDYHYWIFKKTRDRYRQEREY